MDIYTHIKNSCTSQGISIEELAKKVDMSKAGLYVAFKKNTLKFETLEKIVKVLNLNISYFIGSKSTESDEKDKEIEKLNKRISELDELIKANKKEILESRGKFFTFLFTLYHALMENKVFKDKKIEKNIKEVYYDWFLQTKYFEENILEEIKNKNELEFFSMLAKETRKYWLDYLQEHNKMKKLK